MTKKQIRAMRDAITGAWLTLASMRMPAAVFSRALLEKRLDVVLNGIRERVRWHEEHAAQSRGTVDHCLAHPELYRRGLRCRRRRAVVVSGWVHRRLRRQPLGLVPRARRGAWPRPEPSAGRVVCEHQRHGPRRDRLHG